MQLFHELTDSSDFGLADFSKQVDFEVQDILNPLLERVDENANSYKKALQLARIALSDDEDIAQNEDV